MGRNELGSEIARLFERDKDLSGVIVSGDGAAPSLVARHGFYQRLGRLTGSRFTCRGRSRSFSKAWWNRPGAELRADADWETATRLRAAPETATIPILGLSAHTMSTDRQKALDAGCSDYDSKPIDLTRLVGKIEALLAGSAVLDG